MSELMVSDLEAAWMRHSAGGRPAIYSDELAGRVLDWIAGGGRISRLNEQEWAPSWTTVHKWMKENVEFANAMERARAIAASLYAEQAAYSYRDALDSIKGDKSDSARVNAHRIKFEGMKWLAAVSDSRYSDKQMHHHAHSGGVAVAITGLDKGQVLDADVVTDQSPDTVSD